MIDYSEAREITSCIATYTTHINRVKQAISDSIYIAALIGQDQYTARLAELPPTVIRRIRYDLENAGFECSYTSDSDIKISWHGKKIEA